MRRVCCTNFTSHQESFVFRLEWDSKASISGGRRSACSEAFRRDRRGEPGGNGEDGEASLRTRRTSQTLPVLIPKTSALMQVYVLSEERLAGCVGDCKLTGIGLAAHPQPCPDKSGTAVATGAKQSLSTSCRNTCSNSSLCSVILIRVASRSCACWLSSNLQKRKYLQPLSCWSIRVVLLEIMPPKFPVHPFQTEALTTTVVREVKSM